MGKEDMKFLTVSEDDKSEEAISILSLLAIVSTWLDFEDVFAPDISRHLVDDKFVKILV